MAVAVVVSVRADTRIQTAEPAAPASPPSEPVVDAVSPPTWTGARRASWASDGSRTIFFELAATRAVPVWMSSARPVLIVRCLSRVTEVFVALGTSARFEEQVDRRTVRVQWDDEPLSVQRWSVSESARELFAPNGETFVRRMATARRLQFGFSPFNAQPVMVDFAVQGFEPLAGLVADTCSWRLNARTEAG